MDWQQLASLSVVTITAVLLVRSEWRRRQRAKLRACGSDCGCGTSQPTELLKTPSLPESASEILEKNYQHSK